MYVFRLAVMVAAILFTGAAWAQAVPQSREQIQLSFSPVVKQATPAVVNIYTRRVVQAAASPLFADPFFRQFFGDQMGIPQQRVRTVRWDPGVCWSVPMAW